MLTALQQKTAWEEWLGSEIRALYFADLAYRYQRTQRLVTWVTVASSSGALVTLIAALPPAAGWVRLALALVATASSLWVLVAQHGRAASDCADLQYQWHRLADQYQALWDRTYAPDAGTVLSALTEQTAVLSKRSSAFPNRPRLMTTWQDYVERHHATDVAA